MKKYLIIIFTSLGILYSQCENLLQLQCSSEENCEWVENIEWGSCGNLNPTWWNGAQFCDDPSTNSDNCYTYTCYGGSYGSWSTCCGGDSYEIDNSYCEEIPTPECSELNQNECNHHEFGENCNWSENIENNSCSNFSQTHCDSISGCNWESVCISWGSWYTWICYEYGYECTGTYEVDNGFCEDSEFILGDVNQDYIINVMDIILVVNLILENQVEHIADLNNDHLINVIDIVMILDIILQG